MKKPTSYIKEIAKKLSKDTGLNRDIAKEYVERVFECVAGEILDGKRVIIWSFGTFDLKTVKEKKGLHLPHVKGMVIPAHTKLVFKSVPSFKQLVWKKLPVSDADQNVLP